MIVALAVGIEKRGKPVPSRMIWVEVPGLFHQRTATFPVSGIRNEKTDVPNGEAVHGIEFDGPLRRAAKSLRFPPEKQHRRQRVMGQVIRWRHVNGAPGRS